MKKILFVAINAKYIHTNLALLYLHKITGSFIPPDDSSISYTSEIAEFTINQSEYEILSGIVNQNPDIIAFSVYIWNSQLIKSILTDLCGLLDEAKIILGGPEVSYEYSGWISCFPNVSYIISGWGEGAWLTLLNNDFTLECEKNQSSSSGKELTADTPYVISSLKTPFDNIPFPYDELNLAQLMAAYDEPQRSRIVYYESSRGCPFHCSFCLASMSRGDCDYRDIDTVKEELDFFIVRKVPLVKFIDRTFNSDAKRARAIWKHLIDNNDVTRFHFELNPYILEDEDIILLKSAPEGYFQFELGIQSTCVQTLKATGRFPYLTQELLDRFFETFPIRCNTLRPNISIHLDLVFGLPYEDYEGAATSFDTVYHLQPDTFQAGMLKVLPGSPISKKKKAYGIINQNTPPYRVLQTKWLSFKQLNKLYRIEHLLNNLYNSHKFERTLNRLVDVCGSPFSLFEQLDDFWTEQKVSYLLKDWIKTAKLLTLFYREKDFTGYEALIDCLRWDLCLYSGLHGYPDFLNDEFTEHLVSLWHRFRRSKESAALIAPELIKNRRSLIYKPQTSEFRERYKIADDDCLIVLYGKDSEPAVKLIGYSMLQGTITNKQEN